ncbi:MAG: hypothetical protein LBQ66_06570 [Planctomycetaceae bacterium]|nr:hypothetical protein [Planctomycetaceae bacterium]
MVFSSNLFGSITHRGGRDARVPARFRFAEFFFACRAAAIVGYADEGQFGISTRKHKRFKIITPTSSTF